MKKELTVEQIEKEVLVDGRLSRNTKSYYTAGANGMITLRENLEAYEEIQVKAAAQIDPSKFKGLKTAFLGQEINTPIGVASTAFHRIAHPDGEVATARACSNTLQTPLLLSSWATTSIEEVSQNAPNCLKMYQLYMSKDEKVNKDLFKRCRDNGYSAICLTTDTQLLGKRESDFRLKFQLPSHLTLEILKKYQL